MGFVLSSTRTYTKFNDKSSRGAFKTNLLDNVQSPTLALLSSRHHPTDTYSAMIPGCSTNWPLEHLEQVSLYFLTRVLLNWHQTLLIYLGKVWLFQKLTKESNTIPKPRYELFWKVTTTNTTHSKYSNIDSWWNCIKMCHPNSHILIFPLASSTLILTFHPTLKYIFTHPIINSRSSCYFRKLPQPLRGSWEEQNFTNCWIIFIFSSSM